MIMFCGLTKTCVSSCSSSTVLSPSCRGCLTVVLQHSELLSPWPCYQLLFGYRLLAQSKVSWRKCGPTPQQILRYTLKSEPWWVSGCLQREANLREGSVSLAECPSCLRLSHVSQSPETPAHALEQLRAEVGTHPCPTAIAVTCRSRTECPGKNTHAAKISLRFTSAKMYLSLSSYLGSA